MEQPGEEENDMLPEGAMGEGDLEEEEGDFYPQQAKPGDEEDLLEDDINVTDSQVMIQLKEAEDEAEGLRAEIAQLRSEIEEYNAKEELDSDDAAALSEKQELLMKKLALLDAITKRISKLMEFAARRAGDEEATILEEEEEEGEEETLPDDLLPRVVICSSWDDMMPKVVVCMDMKKPGAAKKMEDRDENGLTPEQREALEQERRCMAEERSRLQYQIANLEGEMRVMMRENEMLSKKVAQLKAEAENQPPFEFEMSVSATQPPGCGGPKPGNMDMGIGVMGPKQGGNYSFGGTVAPGGEVTGCMNVQPVLRLPSSDCGNRRGSQPKAPQNNGKLPCGGYGTPEKSAPCHMMTAGKEDQMGFDGGQQDLTMPPYGKKCRKDFNAENSYGGCCGKGCGGQEPYGAMMSSCPDDKPGGPSPYQTQPPLDLNFKVNVQPQNTVCGSDARGGDATQRSTKIAQQLQEIEMEVKRMQKELNRAKSEKETLRAQQAALNCAKNSLH